MEAKIGNYLITVESFETSDKLYWSLIIYFDEEKNILLEQEYPNAFTAVEVMSIGLSYVGTMTPNIPKKKRR
jgi:hypothetical protein